MIYHTDQVTKPIKQWTRVKVLVDQMPFRLKLDKSLANGYSRLKRNYLVNGNYEPVHDNVHYVRVSAVNSQMGEGPYSNIIELKTFNKGKFGFFVYFRKGKFYFIFKFIQIVTRV